MRRVSGNFVQVVLQSAERRGLARDKVLAATGLPMFLMESSIHFATDREFYRLWQYLVDVLQDEFLGLTRKPARGGSFSMACRQAIRCDNLQDFFKEVHHVYELLESDLNIELVSDSDGEVVMTMSQSNGVYDISHFAVESWLLRWHRVACWVTGMNTTPLRAEFSYPEPAHVAKYHDLFQCTLAFGQERNALVFEQDFAHREPIRSSKELDHFAEEVPTNFMLPLGEAGSLQAEIRQLIVDRSPQNLNFPPFEMVAETLNMSPRTLHRKLLKEGTDYCELKKSIRRDFVFERLGDLSVSVSDIAHGAGFKEISSLDKVFKKWTGMSPSAFRKELNKND